MKSVLGDCGISLGKAVLGDCGIFLGKAVLGDCGTSWVSSLMYFPQNRL